MLKLVNQISNSILIVILKNIVKNKSFNKLSNYHLVYLSKFLLDKTNSNPKDFYLIYKIINDLHLDFNNLYDLYLDVTNNKDLNLELNKSIEFYKNLDLNKFFINSNLDRITNDIILILSNSNYIYSNKFLDSYYKELEFYLNEYLELNKINKPNSNNLHKYIRIYDVFNLLDKIYSNNLNKVVTIDFSKSNYNNLKDFINNNLNLICVKIDSDLLKSNQYKLNRINHLKIQITYYDVSKSYFICNKFDLLDLDLNYSYDFNNLLSYLLDNHISYYDLFNDNKLKSKIFKTKNFKGFNKILINKSKLDLKINSKFKYKSNDFNTFNDLLDLDLDLKYLDLDLNKLLKQLDLELISIDNNLDYNSLLDKYYSKFNSLLYDLDLDKDYLKSFNIDLINSLIDIKDIKLYNDNYLDYLKDLYNLDFYIDFINIINDNQIYLNEFDLNYNNLNNINNDIKVLNQILNIFDNLYKDLDKNNTLYEFNKLNYLNLNDIKLKNHNTIFKNSIHDFKKVCYNTNKTGFYYSE